MPYHPHNGNNSATTVAVAPNTDPLAGPVGVDTSYNFGDWSSGATAAKEQANAQAALDYYQWVRNENSAQRQRDWEEMMSSTSVQRSMKDLQAAGLNPWLAVQSAGFGGAVPQGAVATSSAGQAASGKGGSGTLAGLGTAAAGLALLVKAVAKALK